MKILEVAKLVRELKNKGLTDTEIYNIVNNKL